MSLSPKVLDFIRTRSQEMSVSFPDPEDNLFANELLDSFTLIHLISVIEQEYNIKVPDHELQLENFQSLDEIGKFVNSRRT